MKVSTLMIEPFEIVVGVDDSGLRLDNFIAKHQPLARSIVKELILQGHILNRNKPIIKPGLRIQPGDVLTLKEKTTLSAKVGAEKVGEFFYKDPLEILYEDECLIVVNKPSGIRVHPSPGSHQASLLDQIQKHCGQLSKLYHDQQPERDGVVHRLDRDTSGAMVFAKTNEAHVFLAEQFQKKTNLRVYEAILNGVCPWQSSVIESYLYRDPQRRMRFLSIPKTQFLRLTEEEQTAHAFRYSKSEFKRLEVFFNRLSLVEVKLYTGRTHQIRVHSKSLALPVLGDLQYQGPCMLPQSFPASLAQAVFRLKGQLLHAKVLGFTHPISGQWTEYKAEAPAIFKEILEKLRLASLT